MALKKHPDKRPASERAEAEREFDALQKAYDALSDAEARRALDDVLRARAARKAAHALSDAKRKRAVEDLEARERAAAGGEIIGEERAARDRLRAELERLRKQYDGKHRKIPTDEDGDEGASTEVEVPEHLYRTLKVVWRKDHDGDASGYSAARLKEIFAAFGAIEDVVIREGKKKKGSALVVFRDADSCVKASTSSCGEISNPLIVTRAAIPNAKAQAAQAEKSQEKEPTKTATGTDGAKPHVANLDFESAVLERLKRAQERARLVAEAEAED